MVTGAGSGFGLATAVHLAGLGFRVIGAVPDDDGLAALGRGAASRGVEVEGVVTDLADPEARARLSDGRRLYALVNNAGYLNAGLLRDIPDEDARRQLEVMVIGPLDLARRALGPMLERGEGRIINLTSAAVHTSTPFSGWYQACKAALCELTDALREELADTPLVVVEVESGGFATGIWPPARGELLRRRATSVCPDAYERPLALANRYESRLGGPEDVAGAIAASLTTSRPRAHVRVGPDAGPLRLLAEVLPDRVWDRAVGRATEVA